MLDPRWKAIGIAREQGSKWRWATDFGTVLDCPSPSSGPTPAAASSSSSRSLSSARGPIRTVLHAVHHMDRRHRVRKHARHHPKRHAPTRRLADVIAPEGFGPAAAFTISNVAPRMLDPVTLTNRSRDAGGQPVAATVDFGDGSGTFWLGPDASFVHLFLRQQLAVLALTATDEGGRRTTVTRQVFVAPRQT